jgi:hypothetical protein
VPDDFRRDAEMLCHLLSNCVTDLVVSLSMFEQARLVASVRMRPSAGGLDHRDWEQERLRRRQREVELEAAAGISRGDAEGWSVHGTGGLCLIPIGGLAEPASSV